MDSLHPKLDLNEINLESLPEVRRAVIGDFVMLTVNDGGILLKDFIKQSDSLNYSFREDGAGNSYFEWKTTLKEMKQNVDVVVYDETGGYFYEGNGVRRLLGLPDRGGTYGNIQERKDVTNFSPSKIKGRDAFSIFISSTSVSRKVKTGDRIVYRKKPLQNEMSL